MIRRALLTAAFALTTSALATAQMDSTAPHPGPAPTTGMGMNDAGAVAAQPTSPPEMTGGTAMGAAATTPDAMLLKELHASNIAEIQEGTMAQSMGTSPKIKKYGKMLVTDHTAADKLVSKNATRLGLTLSDTLPQEQQAEVDGLKGSSAADFDKNFARAEANGHDKVISDVETAQKSLTDKGVKKLTEKLLPKLRKHETAAQALVKGMSQS